jgi:hypothetical protein
MAAVSNDELATAFRQVYNGDVEYAIRASTAIRKFPKPISATPVQEWKHLMSALSVGRVQELLEANLDTDEMQAQRLGLRRQDPVYVNVSQRGGGPKRRARHAR